MAEQGAEVRIIRGSCLCGAVAFEIDGVATPIELCHCTRCRKASGTAFLATFYVGASAFRWTRGEEQVVPYEAPVRSKPPGYRRVFCRSCGSPLPIVDAQRGFAEIPAGAMDDDPNVRPLRHIFTRLAAPWFEIGGNLPEHPEHVPPSDHLIARLSTGRDQ